MIDGQYASEMVDELLRAFSDRAGWPATLFRQSTVGLMEELVMAGAQTAAGVLSHAAFDDLSRQVRQQIIDDPGLGPRPSRGPLVSQSPRGSAEFGPSSFKFKAWRSVIPALKGAYVQNWRKEFEHPAYSKVASARENQLVNPSEAAAYLASHLLHLGLSHNYLSRWLNYRVRHDPSSFTLDDILQQVQDLVDYGFGRIQILVALAQPAQEDIRSTQGWVDARSARQWMTEQKLAGPRTLHGGVLYDSEQWDLDGALLNVAKAVHRLRQRALLKTGKAPEFYGVAWIAGVKDPRRLPTATHLGKTLMPGYELVSPQVEAPASDDRLEVAVDLLLAGLSEVGASAAGTLWAALEALLAAPGDPDRIQVANRAGDIALVALVRSSIQISLGVLSSRCPDEPMATRLGALPREARLIALEEALRNDEHAAIAHRSTRLALDHTKRLFDVTCLQKRREELRQTLRGLYRHRNLVLHGGVTDGPLLEGILRAAGPLVAAVVNRYARFRQERVIDPQVFAFEMFVRLESYLNDPRTIVASVW